MLANVLLDDLDKELEQRGHRFVRYMDDVVILVKSVQAGNRVMASMTRYLMTKLKLKVNAKKSQVVKTDALEYLGFTFQGIRVYWSEKSFEDFKHRLRQLTSRKSGVSLRYRLSQLNQYLRGWMGYFGISQYYRPIPELDKWIRRRIRMCCWKQWRNPRTRIRELLALGTSKRQAILTGISRKSYWHLSKTLFDANGNDKPMVRATGITIDS